MLKVADILGSYPYSANSSIIALAQLEEVNSLPIYLREERLDNMNSTIESTLLPKNRGVEMRNLIRIFVGLGCSLVLLITSVTRAEERQLLDEPAMFTTHEVSEGGLVALYYKPEKKGRHQAILVLGGSEGGKDGVRELAKPVAEQGFAVLALSYFGEDGLPANLEEIPVEYFQKGIDWLEKQPSVDEKRIGVYGVSKGAEAALLVAAHEKRLRAVAASVPSHVVWQNINLQEFTPRPSWSLNGQPLAFVPYDYSKGFVSVFALYDGALKLQERYSEAEIPVENINGPVFLVSGEEDLIWPSSRMADLVVKRLEGNGFAHSVRHLRYADAGHVVGSPPSLGGQASMLGGSENGNKVAREEMWHAMICFFKENLGG